MKSTAANLAKLWATLLAAIGFCPTNTEFGGGKNLGL